MAAFTRAEWNKVIDDTNAVITNPPNGCDPLPALPNVGPATVWRKQHVRDVQNAIKATCPEISFDEIPTDALWKQSILDEIYAKLPQAWCDCQCDPHAGSGATFTVWQSEPPRVLSDCFGDDIDGDSGIPLCSIIEGMTVAPPGVCGRNWHLAEKRIFNDGSIVTLPLFATGGIRCDGTVACNVSTKVARYGNGLGVNCFSTTIGSCSSFFCTNAIANAEAEIAAHPERYNQYVYVLSVVTTFAECCKC